MRVPAQSRAMPNVFNAGNVVKQLIWRRVSRWPQPAPTACSSARRMGYAMKTSRPTWHAPEARTRRKAIQWSIFANLAPWRETVFLESGYLELDAGADLVSDLLSDLLSDLASLLLSALLSLFDSPWESDFVSDFPFELAAGFLPLRP